MPAADRKRTGSSCLEKFLPQELRVADLALMGIKLSVSSSPCTVETPGDFAKRSSIFPSTVHSSLPLNLEKYTYSPTHPATFFCHVCGTLLTAFLGVSFLFSGVSCPPGDGISPEAAWVVMICCKAEWRLLDRTNITAVCEQIAGLVTAATARSLQATQMLLPGPQTHLAAASSPSFLLVPLSLSSFFFPPPSFPLLPSFLPPLPLLQRNRMEIGKNDANELTCKTDSQIKGTDLWLPDGRGAGEG